MTDGRMWRHLAAGRVQLALIPVAPLLLLPFIIVAFVVLFPLWVVALALLSVARGAAWLVDLPLGKPTVKPGVDHAFQWVLTFGGLARRIGKQG